MTTSLIPITFNTTEEARQIGRSLLEERVALCVNWYPITCAYLWQGEINEAAEVVLIVKTLAGFHTRVEEIVLRQISYTNFIDELPLASVNGAFQEWFKAEVPGITQGARRPSPSEQEPSQVSGTLLPDGSWALDGTGANPVLNQVNEEGEKIVASLALRGGH